MEVVTWFNILIFGGFLALLAVKPKKAFDALLISFDTIKKSGPLLAVLALILIILESSVSVPGIKEMLLNTPPLQAYLAALVLGAGIHIPLFIAFPLGGELLANGVSAGVISVLITTLVMVHTFTLPIEAKEMGVKYAIWRNALSLVAAVAVGLLVGVLY